jgi:hypothetical protein
MVLDIEGHPGLTPGEWQTDRAVQRNGCRDQKVRAGPAELRALRLRKGGSLPGFLAPRELGNGRIAAIREGSPRFDVSTRSGDGRGPRKTCGR